MLIFKQTKLKKINMSNVILVARKLEIGTKKGKNKNRKKLKRIKY